MDDSGHQIFERLLAKLTDAGVVFQHTRHEPVYTSAEAARVRGSTLRSGAKALIVKGGDACLMVVLPADLSLDSNALRKHLRVKRLRFATQEEVLAITGLTPGSIPPFGSLFDLTTICDERLSENEQINFNAGSHTESLQMTYDAYVAYETPTIVKVAKAVSR
jgi:Ala-tRNA(Pro) deacylase